jgi:predicted PilT family ATPase
VGEHNPFGGSHHKVKVPDKFVGLIIGKNGETLKGIAQRSNTKIFVPQKNVEGTEERTVEMTGDA